MLQLKKRKDGKVKHRFMATICFYQDSRHKESLRWIQSALGVGYISHRKDGISEVRINGFKTVGLAIEQLMPFIRFKKTQAELLLKAVKILEAVPGANLTDKDLKEIVGYMLAIQAANYKTRRKNTKEDLYKVLGLTP